MSLKQITENNFYNLQRSIDPSPLLGRLRSVQFVKDRISCIKQQLTVDDKNEALLDALLEVPDDMEESVMTGFISAFRLSGQDHVANIFRRESDEVLMSEEHWELLSKKRSVICRFMNPKDGLIDELISLEVFLEMDREKVLSKAKLNDMAQETVNILMRKSDSAFDKFLNALDKTNQSHVRYLLTGVGNPQMSDEHRNKIRSNRTNLVKFMDTENGLLDHLIEQEIISYEEAERILPVKDQNDKAKILIDILLRKSDHAFQKFTESLRETGQIHVAYILTGEGNSQPLKEEHRRRLLSGPRNYLAKKIDSKYSGLISSLMSKYVFTAYDEQRVTSVQPDTHEDRNELMLNLIARKSQSDFFNFISALNDTGQTHVVIDLIGADVVAKIKTVYESGTDNGHTHGVDAELLEYMKEMFQTNGEVVRRLNEILSKKEVAVTAVRQGCIEVTFTCKNVDSFHNFRNLYNSGELLNMLNEAFCPEFAKKGLTSLTMVISNDRFQECAQTFSRWSPMTSEHREALLSSAKVLADTMTVSDDLLGKLSLCERRREAIECAATSEQKVETLLDIVLRQPDSAFTQLLDVLNNTQQTEAADIISGATKTKEPSELHSA